LQWTVRGGWRKEIELELEGKFSESPYLIVRVLKKKKRKREREREKNKLNPTSQRTYSTPNIYSKVNLTTALVNRQCPRPLLSKSCEPRQQVQVSWGHIITDQIKLYLKKKKKIQMQFKRRFKFPKF